MGSLVITPKILASKRSFKKKLLKDLTELNMVVQIACMCKLFMSISNMTIMIKGCSKNILQRNFKSLF